MADDLRDPLRDHPVMTGSPSVGLLTAEAPKFPAQDPRGNDGLESDLRAMNLPYEKTRGRYEAPEQSFVIYGPTKDQLFQLGQKYGQEAVIHKQLGTPHELLYTSGPYAGHSRLSQGHEYFDKEPEDYYTLIPSRGFLRLNFDFNGPPPHVSLPLVAKSEGPRWSPLTKSEPRHQHPHAYEWHASHTSHARQHAGAGVDVPRLAKAEGDPHPHMDAPPVDNDQAAGVGVSTYAHYARPYGILRPGMKSDLFHYPLHGKLQQVRQLVANHGYQTYYAGGRFGRPDLANRNYNTKHLMIYDPTPQSGSDFGDRDYTDAWRQSHELAHALVYPELNSAYGEGRRIGKLGTHRTMHEAMRAVEWEWMAAHKQRQLLQQVGVHVSDDAFHRELATVMHDAVHRAVTGKFTEPSGEGFVPHAHKVPLEVAHQLVRDAAAKLGLTAPHALLTKAEGRQSWPNRSLRT